MSSYPQSYPAPQYGAPSTGVSAPSAYPMGVPGYEAAYAAYPPASAYPAGDAAGATYGSYEMPPGYQYYQQYPAGGYVVTREAKKKKSCC
ncbi:unnamed protein product [Vitrella brassicaformis CCMP3155]|uniref:Uncharacterized protein n=2 Tax=Vitrella brassicaformis TaxID=1169539 RepID=A0A0G4EAH9_VITBC|nr:unnamed protein product [Vitrella brassicaformis CCMP3155]|eukprot:CEL92966.1 unnamed protein product [Vitrella brassicaformis CCMP3155]